MGNILLTYSPCNDAATCASATTISSTADAVLEGGAEFTSDYTLSILNPPKGFNVVPSTMLGDLVYGVIPFGTKINVPIPSIGSAAVLPLVGACKGLCGGDYEIPYEILTTFRQKCARKGAIKIKPLTVSINKYYAPGGAELMQLATMSIPYDSTPTEIILLSNNESYPSLVLQFTMVSDLGTYSDFTLQYGGGGITLTLDKGRHTLFAKHLYYLNNFSKLGEHLISIMGVVQPIAKAYIESVVDCGDTQKVGGAFPNAPPLLEAGTSGYKTDTVLMGIGFGCTSDATPKSEEFYTGYDAAGYLLSYTTEGLGNFSVLLKSRVTCSGLQTGGPYTTQYGVVPPPPKVRLSGLCYNQTPVRGIAVPIASLANWPNDAPNNCCIGSVHGTIS